MTHIIFLIALICSFPFLNKKYPFRKFSFVILFLFLALRYNYGNDYIGYYGIHTAINNGLSAWGASDILFKYFNLLIPNFFLFIAIISLFYILTIYFLIKQNLNIEEYWVSILFLLINPYLFLVHLSSLRQTLGICFFIFAVNFAIKRKLVMYIIFTIFAVGMHASAIILLPIYFILNKSEFSKKYIFITYVLLIALIATPLFDIVAYKILGYLPSHYETLYFEEGLQNSLRSTLLSSFFFFVVIFNINKLEGKEIVYGKLSLIGTVISLLSIKVSMITRIGMYFDIFLIITIPQILVKIKTKAYKQILFIIMILIYLLRYYSFFNNPMWSEAYRTYRTILER